MKTKVRKFYYEYGGEDFTWDVMEEGGGKEHGQYYDTLMFSCTTEQDAIDAVELLIELQQGTQ